MTSKRRRVGDDVMHRHDQQVVVVGKPDEQHAHERRVRKIKWDAGLRLRAHARASSIRSEAVT